MSSLRIVWVACVAVLCGTPLVCAQTLEADSLARQRQVQQRVREMAEQLVGSVLDVQLQQLEENGLSHLDLYRDIQTMRTHLDTLVGSAMPEIVQLLNELEAAEGDQRRKVFTAAREKSREIVVRLIVERQALLKRLKIAELAAQVRQLIHLETEAMAATQLLPEQPANRRESLNLATLEDQRDVRALYGRFVETLEDVSGWTGVFGAEAARGLRLLGEARVDQELIRAESSLQSAAFAEATGAQKAVIRGLRSLLTRIQRAQGLMNDASNAAAADEVREMIERQEKLQETTRKGTPEQIDDDELVEQQRGIRDDIRRLADATEHSPDIEQALARAEQSADQARNEMFDQQRDEALTSQQRVVEQLEQAAEELAESAFDQSEGLTAEEYAGRIEDLEAAREDLEQVEALQQQASQQAEENPAAARQQEQAAEQKLAKIPEGRDVTPPVESGLDEARQATHQAAAQMSAPPEPRQEAVRQADEAVEQAVSETEAALADARREQLLTEIRELAHAAQALDRATREERQIAAEADQAARTQGIEQDQAADLSQRQSDVQQVADKVAEGVKNTVPEAARTLQQAGNPMEAAAKQLEAANEQPGQPSKPAAEQAAKQASQAADLLDQAASEVRKQLRQAAQQMEQVAGQQSEQAEQTRQAVENQLAQNTQSPADRMNRLQQAQEKVAKAQADQAKAMGQPEPTGQEAQAHGDQSAQQPGQQQDAQQPQDSQDTSQQAGQQPQDDGDQSAQQPGHQQDGQQPQTAAQSQKAVTEDARQAAELARRDAPKAAATLERAAEMSGRAEEAATAAKEDESATAQQATADLLDEAAEQLEQAAADLTQRSQKQLAQTAEAAGQLAQQSVPVDPGATSALRQAERQAEQAAAAAPAQAPDQPPAGEPNVQEALGEAAGSLAERQEQIDQDRAEAMAMAAAGMQPAGQPAESMPGSTPQAEQSAGQPQPAGEPTPDQQAGAEAQSTAPPGGQPAPPAGTPGEPAPGEMSLPGAAELANVPIREAAQLAAQMAGVPSEGMPGMDQTSSTPTAQMPAAASLPTPSQHGSQTAASGGMAQSGSFFENQEPLEKGLQSPQTPRGQGTATPDSDKEAEPGERRFADEPWFAKLPPELRNAIRNNARRRPPRGYEERLQRYFESMD